MKLLVGTQTGCIGAHHSLMHESWRFRRASGSVNLYKASYTITNFQLTNFQPLDQNILSLVDSVFAIHSRLFVSTTTCYFSFILTVCSPLLHSSTYDLADHFSRFFLPYPSTRAQYETLPTSSNKSLEIFRVRIASRETVGI